MPSLSALGEVPLGALGGDSGAPADTDLSSGAGCFDDPLAIFLNVLESVGAAIFPSGEALIANALDAGAFIGAGGMGSVRFHAQASDAALLTLDNASQILSVLKDRIIAAAMPDSMGCFRSSANVAAAFTDAVAAAWSMLVEDGASAADTNPDELLRRYALMSDMLMATGAAQARLDAQIAVAVAVALDDMVKAGWDIAAVDQASLVGHIQDVLRGLVQADDAAVAAAGSDMVLRMVLLAADSAALSEDPATVFAALAEAHEEGIVYCNLRLDGMDYQGWVLNTDLRALTEYRNVPFDSYAILNGRTYAAGDDGIFELAGGTDAGKPIEAWFRPFLTNFGTQKMKRVTDLWIGSSSAGLFVKVHTKDPATGQMVEDIYPVQRAHGAGGDKVRVKVGRGLVSNYWTLTVGNIAGADFDVQSIEWKLLVLDRRQ